MGFLIFIFVFVFIKILLNFFLFVFLDERSVFIKVVKKFRGIEIILGFVSVMSGLFIKIVVFGLGVYMFGLMVIKNRELNSLISMLVIVFVVLKCF